MRFFGLRIIKESEYRKLLRYRIEVGEILKKKLPLVLNKTLHGKNITLSRGLVLINSSLTHSRIFYKAKEAIKSFWNSIIQYNYFEKQSRGKK
ncbi:MAG: hypothetical protein E3J56_01080 [Candidatus Aminicenantes bacterium]|nr:MAG: hypothetical protein E3J56_01080 [Candidatus Aminicenantes bacterium]